MTEREELEAYRDRYRDARVGGMVFPSANHRSDLLKEEREREEQDQPPEEQPPRS